MLGIESTFTSDEPFLKDLLYEIGQGKLQLPDFQRPWVWDDIHIRSLLTSVSLSYPIGAIMILQTSDSSVRFKPRLVEGVVHTKTLTPERLILDGQQRLTSLFGALMSKNPVKTRNEKQKPLKRWYYLHIDKCLDPQEDRFDAVISIPEDKCVRSDFGRIIDLDLSSRVNEYEKGMVPLGLMFSNQYFEWHNGFMQHFQWNEEKVQQITLFQQEVWMRFQQFKIPVIQLLSNTPKEAVCQVFEKVNTGGVALSVFELVTASFAADDFLLRKDWTNRSSRLYEYDVLRAVEGTEFLLPIFLTEKIKVLFKLIK